MNEEFLKFNKFNVHQLDHLVTNAAPPPPVVGHSDTGAGVAGSSGQSDGVYGVGAIGVHGQSQTGDHAAVWGQHTANGYGVIGDTTADAPNAAMWGRNGGAGFGVRGTSNANGVGVFGEGKTGVHGTSANASDSGVLGENSAGGTGVTGTSNDGIGVSGTSQKSTGVSGTSQSASGVAGVSTTGTGVHGTCDKGYGIFGDSEDGVGVAGASKQGLAAHFMGKVRIDGALEKGGGGFKIDHPLDPAHKYLNHSFVESPHRVNIYNDNATLDAEGRAVIELPVWFGVLNRDFRYQLTPIGGAMPNLHIAEVVRQNRFVIAGGTPGLQVSWQITGVRQDAWANANPLPVEEDKPAHEMDTYLHPDLFVKEHGNGYHP